MKRWVPLSGVLATFLLAALPTSASAQAGIGGMTISPLMFRERVGGGARLPLQIEVQNLQQDTLNIKVSIQEVTYEDWTYNPIFGKQNPNDCSGWFEKTQFSQSIAPSSQGVVNLSVRVPHVGLGVYWCMARVDPHFASDASTISPEYQIPIILFVGGDPHPVLKLGSPELVSVPGGDMINIPFENTGLGFTTIGAKVELRQSATGRVVGTYYDNDRNLYPLSKRHISFSVDQLGEGQYTLVSRPTAGARSFSPMTRKFIVAKDGVKPDTGNETYELSPVSFDPGALQIQMPAGGERSSVLHVVNNSSKPVAVKITVRALSQDEDGSFTVGEGPPVGPFNVISDPPILQLDPGRVGDVRIAVTTSRQATGDLWFAVSADAQIDNEISEEIYASVDLPGGTPKLALDEIGLKKIGQYPYSVEFHVNNTGNMSLKPLAFAQVLEEGLNPVANLQVPVLGAGGILPGVQLSNQVMLPPNLKPGAYTVSLKYQYGQDMFANLTIPIVVPSGGKPKGKGAKVGSQ